MLTSKNLKDQEAAKKVSIFWPNQDDFGVHINLSGAGVIKNSKNTNNAILFLEFLSSKKAQQIYTKKINEYSIRTGVIPSETVKEFGKFNADNSNLGEIGKKIKSAIYLASKYNWK